MTAQNLIVRSLDNEKIVQTEEHKTAIEMLAKLYGDDKSQHGINMIKELASTKLKEWENVNQQGVKM